MDQPDLERELWWNPTARIEMVKNGMQVEIEQESRLIKSKAFGTGNESISRAWN